MKSNLLCVCLLAVSLTGGSAFAEEVSSQAMEGSYLLLEDNGYQRVISLGPGGIARQVSAEQTVVGFTAGQGAWKATGTDSAKVRIVDFTYNTGDGKPIGPSVAVFELRFADQKDGLFQRLSGLLDGAQHATGQNVLSSDVQPLRTYRTRFSGQRIIAD